MGRFYPDVGSLSGMGDGSKRGFGNKFNRLFWGSKWQSTFSCVPLSVIYGGGIPSLDVIGGGGETAREVRFYTGPYRGGREGERIIRSGVNISRREFYCPRDETFRGEVFRFVGKGRCRIS